MELLYRKMRRSNAIGMCQWDYIELDPRLVGRKHLEILLHEMLHYWFPEMSEEDVIKVSVDMCRTMWKDGYRKVDNDESDILQDGTL